MPMTCVVKCYSGRCSVLSVVCRYCPCVAGVKTSAEAVERRVSETSSFALNLFRGQIRPEEVFPFRDGYDSNAISIN